MVSQQQLLILPHSKVNQIKIEIIITINFTFHDITVPAPSLVISSKNSNPIRPIGSTVTLTCTVELSPLVDVPVTVNIAWTGPAGFTTTNIVGQLPVMGSTSIYTRTAMVSSFGRQQSGVYNCTAYVNSISSNPFLSDSIPLFEATRVTVGKTIIINSCTILHLSDLMLITTHIQVFISL